MIELWGRKNAYNVQKVLWILGELALDYRHYDLGSDTGDLETPDFLALNPHARIPVMRDAGAVVWESNTILRYLAARYSGGDLWRQDPFERSLAERWMDWELSKLQPDFIELFWGFFRTPEALCATLRAARRALAAAAIPCRGLFLGRRYSLCRLPVPLFRNGIRGSATAGGHAMVPAPDTSWCIP
jgi:glutathione S-transferase